MSFMPPAEGASTPRQGPNGSQSPEAPPYSPITPPLQAQQLPPLEDKVSPAFIEKPPEPVDLDMDTNTDAMALRAALAALQMQRIKAVDDMKTLDRLKTKALSDPERFAHGLVDGSIKSGEQASPLDALLASADVEDSDSQSDGGSDTQMTEVANGDPATWDAGEKFGTIPAMQNVVRMPPINWAKYHVVGESLDALHDEQRKRPDSGQRQRNPASRAAVHQIAAPYSPWRDKLPESSIRTRSDARRG
ncbi:MAG: hypothetical protein MMC23_009338 [Stictis urceolatum]|nr:hypothetical protein [Stictis urceolata]